MYANSRFSIRQFKISKSINYFSKVKEIFENTHVWINVNLTFTVEAISDSKCRVTINILLRIAIRHQMEGDIITSTTIIAKRILSKNDRSIYHVF